MPNHTNHETAVRFRACAAECVKLAAVSNDANVEAQYTTLAELYVKLAECEERAFQEKSGLDSTSSCVEYAYPDGSLYAMLMRDERIAAAR